jgi:hypothetical protein
MVADLERGHADGNDQRKTRDYRTWTRLTHRVSDGCISLKTQDRGLQVIDLAVLKRLAPVRFRSWLPALHFWVTDLKKEKFWTTKWQRSILRELDRSGHPELSPGRQCC